MSIYQNQMIADLLALGVRPGGVLLVHSSLRALGPQHDPEMAVQALLEALGEQGTLLMPALSYASVRSTEPVFDVRHTPSCVGGLTEYFRTRAGTLRSLHPTHSVCGAGAQAASLLAGHENDHSPVGPNSPFTRLPQVQGQILFLGCGLRPNTSMHGVEELAEPPYLYAPPIDYTLIRADGSQQIMHARRHNFAGWEQRYDRLAEAAPEAVKTGRVLQAGCHLVESTLMWPAALACLRQDPLYFVEPRA